MSLAIARIYRAGLDVGLDQGASGALVRNHPSHLLFRTLFSIFWLAAGINKVVKGWLTTRYPRSGSILDRLTEMPPDAFASIFLQNFAPCPLYQPVAWVVTIGEIYSAVGLIVWVLLPVLRRA